MIPFAINYEFTQKFNAPAQKAFAWCTDYRPEDMTFMQEKNATRKVERIADDVLVLHDIFNREGKSVEKQKLVCLYRARLMWTSTHLSGPNIYSQFLYEITPLKAGQSQLRFTALSLDYEILNSEAAETRSKKLRKMNAENWKLLESEMDKELNREITA